MAAARSKARRQTAKPAVKPPSKRPRGARRKRAAKPHERTKADDRVLSPDAKWAADIRDRVVADCHPDQRDALLDPSIFKTYLVGRGGGKTTTMRADAIIALTSIRRGQLVYIAPTRGMAEELLWARLKDSIEVYAELGDFTFNESKLTCRCRRTGAVLKLLGADDKAEVNKLRGRPFDRVYIDEASLYPAELLEDMIDRAIGPRLGERDGRLVMAGTPGHILRGPFYDFTRPGACAEDEDEDEHGNKIKVPLHRPYADRDKPEYANWDGWSSHTWSLKAVAELPNAAELYPALVKLWAAALRTKRRKRWSDQHPIWLREYLGLWAADHTGMVFHYRPFDDKSQPWNQWNPFGEQKLEGIQALKVAIDKLAELGFRDLHYVISADDGHSDPCALNVFAFSPSDLERRIWHVYSFERTRMRARLIADLLLGPEHDTNRPKGIIGLTGWPDGMVMDTDGGTIDELKNEYGLYFKKAEKNSDYKAGAIEVVNGDFFDGRLKILKGSPLELQLQTLQWAEDQFGRTKEDKRQANHSTDCLIYARRLIGQLFEAGIVDDRDSQPPQDGSHPPAGRGSQEDPGIGTRDEFEGLLADVEYVEWGG